jgi:hypothetical protein
MSIKLVTVATFDEGAKARLAQNVLQAAGIQCTIADESIVAMDWLLSTAVGGVKVQVRDEDAERAVAALNQGLGEEGPVDQDELAAEAEAEAPEDEAPPPSSDDSEPPPAPDSREETARRMIFTSMLGVFLPPVAFYALYLFMVAFFGEGTLSPRGRLHLWLGGAFTLVGLVFMLIVLGVYL